MDPRGKTARHTGRDGGCTLDGALGEREMGRTAPRCHPLLFVVRVGMTWRITLIVTRLTPSAPSPVVDADGRYRQR